ncbi:MAG TPA: hypothetical protein VHM01_02610 [Alphaproteobacteria bacterium]|nr:hypothetical protein [Alphaproteobacteria bacterium]
MENAAQAAAASAPAAEEDDGPVPVYTSDRSTHFAFTHKVFGIKDAVFKLSSTEEPLFHVDLGDLKCGISLTSLRNEFSIKRDSDDGKLLALIEKALRYVKEIRPGDSIPKELLDGSCSWSVEDRHRKLAHNRMTVQLASWLSGGEADIADATKLEKIAGDPETKQRVQKAFAEAAEKIGLGRERASEVIDRFETLARELAYIEALRERFQHVRMIMVRLAEMSQIYKPERAIMEELVRVQMLMRNPDGEFQNDFGLIDAHTCEIVNMLKKIDMQIAFIRSNRDDLHYKLMKWDDLIAKWASTKIEKSEALENLMRATYRFVAQHYPQRSNWQLQNKKRR